MANVIEECDVSNNPFLLAELELTLAGRAAVPPGGPLAALAALLGRARQALVTGPWDRCDAISDPGPDPVPDPETPDDFS